MPTPRKPLTFKEVCIMARELPGVEESTSYGTPALKVKGKMFARIWEDGETLVLRSTMTDRDFLIRDWPKEFFFTDHYRDYPYILVHLKTVSHDRFATVLEDAWRRMAPPTLCKQLDLARATKPAKKTARKS